VRHTLAIWDEILDVTKNYKRSTGSTNGVLGKMRKKKEIFNPTKMRKIY